MAAKKEETAVVIPNVEIKTAVLKIVGDTPLIMHKWSEKAKKEILDKQMKKAKSKGHDAKSPIEDFINSMYWLEGEPEEPTAEAFNEAMKHNPRFGFPSVAFKAAAVSAGYRLGVTQNKVSQNAAFHIDGEMVEIHGSLPCERIWCASAAFPRLLISAIVRNLRTGTLSFPSAITPARFLWNSWRTCLTWVVLPAESENGA